MAMASLSLSNSSSSSTTSSSAESSSDDNSTSVLSTTSSASSPYKPLAVLSRPHSGPISSLSLAGGEFLLSASSNSEIVLWQNLLPLAQFPSSSSSGAIKSLTSFKNLVLTAHQDTRIRVWKLSSDPENLFRLLATLPTKKDRLSNFLKPGQYVQTRRNHRKLWIQHADTISCLAVRDGLIYSGSWDKTFKVWSLSGFRCLESINAHDDAINALAVADATGLVYTASADGKIKMWGRSASLDTKTKEKHELRGCLEAGKAVCWNAIVVCDGGRVVYGGGSDGRLVGWRMNVEEEEEEWRVVWDEKGHQKAVLCLCLTGEFVCSGSTDRSIGVWRREEGEGRLCRVGRIRGHEGPVKCLVATEVKAGDQGFVVYSGGMDGSLRVWYVPKEVKEEEEEEEEMEKKCVLLR